MIAAIRVNGESQPHQATTIAALLQQQGVSLESKGIAVALNGSVVPRNAWAETPLAPGDEVEIVKPIGGG